MKLSIVSTLYKSGAYLSEFHRRVSSATSELVGDDYEIVLVNDGSPDDSLERAIGLTTEDPHLVVVDLSRNFGHHKAILTGLAHSTGDCVFLLDCDLEEDPEYLTEFARTMELKKCDVVYGVQENRKGGWFERWSGATWYYMFDKLANIRHPRNIVTLRLMSRRYVDALLQFEESEMVLSCLWVITGFSQHAQVVRKHKRPGTSYSLVRKLSHVVNAVTSFSAAPLMAIFYTGALIFLSSLLYSAYLVYQKLFRLKPLDGWTSVMLSIWLFSGLIILFIGIIGIYLSKVFMETKRRPSTIVRCIYGRK